MSKYFWILDAGHGGVVNGVPQTSGKRSPEWEKGVLYEGVSNRVIMKKVKSLLDKEGICNTILFDTDHDISLSNRVKKTNSIYNKSKNSILLSFHSDAFTNESASGWSCFTTKGETKSDKISSILYNHAKKNKFKIRTDISDGDLDKEMDFFILRKTLCPAVLIENFFMTNKKDYSFLMSEKGQNKISKMIFDAIKEIELTII